MFASIWMELCAFTLFGALSLVFYDRKGQPLIRRDFIDDAIYFLIATLIYAQISKWIYAHVGAPPSVRPLEALPFAVQVLLLLIVYDFLQYWIHRLFHGTTLWRFHAVHHSAPEIDILTSFRWHPVNFALYINAPTLLLLLLGFPAKVFASVAMFNFLMSCLTHANLSWTYGPFRYVLSSPMFHRWHHAIVEGSRSRNFAASFPVWDLLFGTYYLPRGERPQAYGAPEVPANFTGQLLYPLAR